MIDDGRSAMLLTLRFLLKKPSKVVSTVFQAEGIYTVLANEAHIPRMNKKIQFGQGLHASLAQLSTADPPPFRIL